MNTRRNFCHHIELLSFTTEFLPVYRVASDTKYRSRINLFPNVNMISICVKSFYIHKTTRAERLIIGANLDSRFRLNSMTNGNKPRNVTTLFLVIIDKRFTLHIKPCMNQPMGGCIYQPPTHRHIYV